MSTVLDLDQMTTEEKLAAMEELWEDLSRTNAVPVPLWHKGVLDERQRLIDEGRAEFIDWETAKSQIRERVSPRNAELTESHMANRRGRPCKFKN